MPEIAVFPQMEQRSPIYSLEVRGLFEDYWYLFSLYYIAIGHVLSDVVSPELVDCGQ